MHQCHHHHVVIFEPLGSTSGIVLPEAVTVQLTCTAEYTYPVWILQGQRILDIPSVRKQELGVNLLDVYFVGTTHNISLPVRINGSSAIHNKTLQCSILGEIVYSTTLLYQG